RTARPRATPRGERVWHPGRPVGLRARLCVDARRGDGANPALPAPRVRRNPGPAVAIAPHPRRWPKPSYGRYVALRGAQLLSCALLATNEGRVHGPEARPYGSRRLVRARPPRLLYSQARPGGAATDRRSRLFGRASPISKRVRNRGTRRGRGASPATHVYQRARRRGVILGKSI